jgi:outer membrane protein assembly factor BamB
VKKLTKGKGMPGILLTALLLCALLVPAALPALASLADGTSWEQFHGDVAHKGYSASTAPDTNELAWVSDDIGSTSGSSVVVASGKVFVNGEDHITCLNESNGATLWSEPLTGSSVKGSWLTPAYHDGKVFISGAKVYCFSEDGGSPLWTFDLPNDACNGGPMVADGKVFAGDWDGNYYYCLDENTGALLWTFDVLLGSLLSYAQGTPAYADGKVYFTSWDYVGGNVWCVDANTGVQIWHNHWDPDDAKPMDGDTCGSPCVADGKVFVTTYDFYGDGELIALNADDGSLAWGPITIQRTDSTPAYADGKIYVCGGCFGYSDLQTYCFDATTGVLDWETPVALGVGNWTCSVAVADGKVFVGKPGDFFDYAGTYALDIADGSEVWHYDHGGASPAIANGMVFTIGEGKVWAFGSPSYPDWDVNMDGNINILDVALVGLHWGETGDPGWIREDVNNDGSVDILDVALIGLHWGE